MKTSKQHLKACEGLCIKLPNGKPALQFIAYKGVTVETETKDGWVKLRVEFDEPFIKGK